MKKQHAPGNPACLSIEVFQPKPNIVYSLDVAAHLAGVPRRSILIYCRAGFLRPIFEPPYGMMVFTEEAIHAVRRIEQLRTAYAADMVLLKTIFDLTEEVERLRSAMRFLRSR